MASVLIGGVASSDPGRESFELLKLAPVVDIGESSLVLRPIEGDERQRQRPQPGFDTPLADTQRGLQGLTMPDMN
ncbi:hypothetical protein Ddc_20849 [Ditylenchus destructor]|nr:hypothetical protein Ddc_20849 [Ditylenchus destructor]